MSKIDLDALLNFLAAKRQHGNTTAAIEWIEGDTNATLVCASHAQARELNRGGKSLAISITDALQPGRHLGVIPGDPRPVIFDLLLVEFIAKQARRDEKELADTVRVLEISRRDGMAAYERAKKAEAEVAKARRVFEDPAAFVVTALRLCTPLAMEKLCGDIAKENSELKDLLLALLQSGGRDRASYPWRNPNPRHGHLDSMKWDKDGSDCADCAIWDKAHQLAGIDWRSPQSEVPS